MSIGINDSVLLEAMYFISVIEEFCVYLFFLMAAWLLFLGIAHYTRVFSYKRHLKSFYKGLVKVENKTLFTEYVSSHSNRVKHLKRIPLVDLFMGLLEIFQRYGKNKNRSQYLADIIRLRDHSWDIFSHKNMRSFSIQITAAVFFFIVLLAEIIFHLRPVSFMPLHIVGIFTFFSFWLYMSRQEQSKRAVKEIDKLESIYAKYLNVS
jgi:5'-deoxynucleotidase YfbR-like HD superfamily hydrolase